MIQEKNGRFCENIGNVLVNNTRATQSQATDPPNPVFRPCQWPAVHVQGREDHGVNAA